MKKNKMEMILLLCFFILTTMGMEDTDSSGILAGGAESRLLDLNEMNDEQMKDLTLHLKYYYGDASPLLSRDLADKELAECEIDENLQFATAAYRKPKEMNKFLKAITKLFSKDRLKEPEESIQESFKDYQYILLKNEEQGDEYQYRDKPEIWIKTYKGTMRRLLCKGPEDIYAFKSLIEKNKQEILFEEIIVKMDNNMTDMIFKDDENEDEKNEDEKKTTGEEQCKLKLFSDLTYFLDCQVPGFSRQLIPGNFQNFKSIRQQEEEVQFDDMNDFWGKPVICKRVWITIVQKDDTEFTFRFDHSVDRNEYSLTHSRTNHKGDYFNGEKRKELIQTFFDYLLIDGAGDIEKTEKLLALLNDFDDKGYESILPYGTENRREKDLLNIELLIKFLTNEVTIKMYEKLLGEGKLKNINDACPDMFLGEFKPHGNGMSLSKKSRSCENCSQENITLAEKVLMKQGLLQYIKFHWWARAKKHPKGQVENEMSETEKKELEEKKELVFVVVSILKAFTNKETLLKHIINIDVFDMCYECFN